MVEDLKAKGLPVPVAVAALADDPAKAQAALQEVQEHIAGHKRNRGRAGAANAAQQAAAAAAQFAASANAQASSQVGGGGPAAVIMHARAAPGCASRRAVRHGRTGMAHGGRAAGAGAGAGRARCQAPHAWCSRPLLPAACMLDAASVLTGCRLGPSDSVAVHLPPATLQRLVL